MNRQLQRLACAVAIGIGILSPAPALAASKEQLIGQAEYYLSEFEKEVARQRGGEKAVWRSKQDALSRVQALKEQYPDAWIMGEVIHGDYNEFVEQSKVDSITEYELWKSIWSSISNKNFFIF